MRMPVLEPLCTLVPGLPPQQCPSPRLHTLRGTAIKLGRYTRPSSSRYALPAPASFGGGVFAAGARVVVTATGSATFLVIVTTSMMVARRGHCAGIEI